MKRLIYIFLCLILTSGSGFGQEITEAQQQYVQYCGQCHGAQLQGGNAKSFLTGVWNHGSGNQFRNIKHGITHVGMPSFENLLTDDQIKAIVTFLKSESEKAHPERPPLPDQLLSQDYEIALDIFVEGLQIPWAIDFLDANQALITERPGRLRLV